MSTMQAVKPSSRKRDAEMAFQAPSWDLDEDASQHESTQMSIQDNQAFVEQTLATSRKQTKKIVHNLLDETQKIFSGVETEVKTLQDTYSVEINERINQLEAYLTQTRKANKEPFALSLKRIEHQLTVLDQLGACYAEPKDTEQAMQLDPSIHIKRREQHKSAVSQRGAQVALKQMKQVSRENELRIDTEKFVKAHRDFFQAIQSNRVQLDKA